MDVLKNNRRSQNKLCTVPRPIALSDTCASSLVQRPQRQSSAVALQAQRTGQSTTPSADQRAIALYGVLASRDWVDEGQSLHYL